MNPRKKQRHSLRAVFIGIEDERGGAGDLFIKYIKERFVNRDHVSVTHRPCGGGSYADMLRTARQRAGNDDYDKHLMVWDADRDETGEDKIPSAEKFEYVPMSPCIEGVLLCILGRPVPQNSQKCKAALRAESPFDCIEKFHQKFKDIPVETFRGHPAVSQILSAINPPAPSAAHAYTAHTA